MITGPEPIQFFLPTVNFAPFSFASTDSWYYDTGSFVKKARGRLAVQGASTTCKKSIIEGPVTYLFKYSVSH